MHFPLKKSFFALPELLETLLNNFFRDGHKKNTLLGQPLSPYFLCDSFFLFNKHKVEPPISGRNFFF